MLLQVIVAHIFLIVRILALCSERSLIMGDVEENFIILVSTNIFSMAVFELIIKSPIYII